MYFFQGPERELIPGSGVMIGTQKLNNMYNANTDRDDRVDLAGVFRALMREFFPRKILATSTLRKPGRKGKGGKDKIKNQEANKKEPLNPVS